HLALERRQETRYPIDPPRYFMAQPLEGKHVSDRSWRVKLLELSTQGGLLEIDCRGDNASRDAPLVTVIEATLNAQNAQKQLGQPLTNLKLSLCDVSVPDTLPPGAENREVYAKVLFGSDRPDRLLVQFTSKSPMVARWFQALYDRAQQAHSDPNPPT
ncbi:MAG TPA: hypothetical protein V6D46_04175, partial [Coleofasciculaceae cyanobacterium]